MTPAEKKKKSFYAYILPILFGGLLVALALMKGQRSDQPVKAVLQEGEPLTLTEQALENYLYSAGFTLTGESVLDEEGREAGALIISRDDDGAIQVMTLSFLLTAYGPSENDANLTMLKAVHDEEAQRGEDMFLALFDAIAATDSRVVARRDSAAEKLRAAMDAQKASVQAANSWRFSFSLASGEVDGTITVLFEKVK